MITRQSGSEEFMIIGDQYVRAQVGARLADRVDVRGGPWHAPEFVSGEPAPYRTCVICESLPAPVNERIQARLSAPRLRRVDQLFLNIELLHASTLSRGVKQARGELLNIFSHGAIVTETVDDKNEAPRKRTEFPARIQTSVG